MLRAMCKVIEKVWSQERTEVEGDGSALTLDASEDKELALSS